MKMSVRYAADILLRGGVIAYPTEGVFGLGCLPDNLSAVQRVLHIKQRESDKGLILIAAMASQFEGWISLPDGQTLPDPDPVVQPGGGAASVCFSDQLWCQIQGGDGGAGRARSRDADG